ncbi:hypothetical protein JCM8547_007777 [Rhodosporidiobolus lusitaniae]
MATASPAGPASLVDLSLNSPLITRALDNDHPAWDTPTRFSPTKRSKGKRRAPRRDSALEAKDHNKDEGMLVDVEQSDEGFKASLAPPVGSHFALSLLDKSPSLLKAHLKTPLVPLGSPITARKIRRTALQQENSPCVRNDEKRSFSSPTPASDGDLPPSSPVSSPAPPDRVRFSPAAATSPRLRTSPRKAASRSTPSASPSLNTTPFSLSRPPQNPRLASLATPLQRFSAHPLSAASPFAFSPYTPPVRPHASYRDEDLTDCDADFSLYDEQDEDDRSLSYPAAVEGDEAEQQEADEQRDEELVEALQPLSLEECVNGDAEDVAPEADEDAHETSIELTATELATSEEELEREDKEGEESVDSSVTSEDEEETDEGAEPVKPAEQEKVNVQVEEEQVKKEEAEKELEQQAKEDLPLPRDYEKQEEQEQEAEAVEVAAPLEVGLAVEEPLRSTAGEPEQPLETPPSPVSSPPPSPHLAPVAAKEVDEPVEEAAPLLPTPSTPRPAESPSAKDDTPRDESTPMNRLPVFAVSTPPPSTPIATPQPAKAAPPPSARLTTPPAGRSRTPSSLKPSSLAPPTAAPTAQRQLTKITSLAAQRAAAGSAPPASAAKPATTLTSLIPGSAAIGSRRLVAPSARSGLPKPASAVPSSVARDAPLALAAVKEASEVETERHTSSTSASINSASSSAAAPRSRPPLKPTTGLRPPGSAAPNTTASRTLASTSTAARAAASAAAAKPLAPRAARGLLPTSTTASRLTRTTSTADAPPTSSLRPTSTLTSRAPSPLLQTSSTPTLANARAPSPSLPLPSRPARTPRAALTATASASTLLAKPAPSPLPLPTAAKPAPAPLPLPLPTASTSSSPVKRKPARFVGGKVEVAKSAVAELPVASTAEPAQPSLHSSTPEPAPSAPAPTAIFDSLTSPPRSQAVRPPGSPVRSPRRVLVSTQLIAAAMAAGPALSSSPASSALSAPASKLVASTASAEAVFGAAAPPAAKPALAAGPVRSTRTRRTRPLDATESAPAAFPARTTRRTAASSAATALPLLSQAPAPPAPSGPPIVRSARRPLRKAASDEPAAPSPTPSDETASTTEETQSTASSEDLTPFAPSLPIRPTPSFHSAPSLTQAELTRLTSRNTKKNQQPFNKLKFETLFLDYDRPPSPTSKIRRTEVPIEEEGGVGKPSTKEGREARAAKRNRGALRASVDGTESEMMAKELGLASSALSPEEEAEKKEEKPEPVEHFRAPGDDEQYVTPLRTTGVLLSKKAAAGSRKSSRGTSLPSTPEVPPEAKRVKWDKALVYEGSRVDALPLESEGILKQTDLDDWGNSTTAISSFGKAAPVTIVMRVFRNDQKTEG